MSFEPKSQYQTMNIQQFRQNIKHCQETLDSTDPDTGEPNYWKVYGLLTFRGHVTLSRGRQLFYRWLGEIKKQVKRGFVNWYFMIAHDSWKRETRIHFLLGGSDVIYGAYWTARWQRLSGGDATISEYRPDAPDAFVRHVLKNAHDGQYFQISMDFCGYGPFDISTDPNPYNCWE